MLLFTPQSSSHYVIYLTLIHLFATICVFSLPFPFFFLFIFIVYSFLFWISKNSEKISLCHVQKNEWKFIFSGTHTDSAILLPTSVMFPFMLVLQFQVMNANQQEKRQSIVLFSDSFTPEEYRTLRRAMRMGYI